MTVPDRPTGADYANDSALSNRAAILNLELRVGQLERVAAVQIRATSVVEAATQAGLEEAVAKRLWEIDGYTHWDQTEVRQQWRYKFKAREILAIVASYQDNGTGGS